ncbi:MHC class II transactivator [Rhizophlyctis rosea]|uniref:MHC class II transactivator n=1 Tax=Rhizophlyctis rosea TaxID=64517 RepID=A0AAD5X6Z2_9FUNG|nr:MHC class II transactivator [Rhizophlyctis rosea]
MEARKDTEWLGYKPSTGTWKFRVRHFSQYSAPDDLHGEEEVQNEQTGKEVISDGCQRQQWKAATPDDRSCDTFRDPKRRQWVHLAAQESDRLNPAATWTREDWQAKVESVEADWSMTHTLMGGNVPIKYIDKSKLDPVASSEQFRKVGSMKLLFHPQVVRLYEVIDTSEELYLVMEYDDGNTLSKLRMRVAQILQLRIVPSEGGFEETRSAKIQRPLVLDQLRWCNGVLEGVRICTAGFPNRLPFADFRQWYHELLALGIIPKGYVDGRQAGQKLLAEIRLNVSQYRIGLSMVFFKAGVPGELRDRPDITLSKIVQRIEALIRAVLARKTYRKVKDKPRAVKIIQRNAQIYVTLRELLWWKLYTKVKPLLDVSGPTKSDFEQTPYKRSINSGKPTGRPGTRITPLNPDLWEKNLTVKHNKKQAPAGAARARAGQ